MVWQYILAFILFLLCLSILIMIHEAGHLAMAKAFNVYCFEYSIGFGPALFHKKRKNGETYFSIRAIPFGGFVSMYGEQETQEGEEAELPPGVELLEGMERIPEERSLSKIKPWKRAIILVAGVTLNAILALVLFFISACLPQQRLYIRYVEVEENSVAYNAGLRNEDILYYQMPTDEEIEKKEGEAYDALSNGYYILDKETIVNFDDASTKYAATLIDGSADSKLSFKTRDYDRIIKYFYLDDNGIINYTTPVDFSVINVTSITVNFKTVTYTEENPSEPILTGNTYTFTLNNNNGTLDSYGVKMRLVTEKNTFGQIIKNTFTNFGDSALLIFKTIGGLFIGRGWNQVGGIVAVYQQSATIFTQYNASLFIYLWALISVNLAVFNLLPFPGLDGWQLLVLFVESVFRKQIPPKVKSIVSLVGMILLFAFMALIIVKDVIGLF